MTINYSYRSEWFKAIGIMWDEVTRKIFHSFILIESNQVLNYFGIFFSISDSSSRITIKKRLNRKIISGVCVKISELLPHFEIVMIGPILLSKFVVKKIEKKMFSTIYVKYSRMKIFSVHSLFQNKWIKHSIQLFSNASQF